MPAFDFPVFDTRVPGVTDVFRLEDPVDRRRYFIAKAGAEIEKLKGYLRGDTFIAFLLGPKNSGKGTYTKLFMEAVGDEHITHVSVGDIVRSVHRDLEDAAKREELMAFLRERYRGFLPVEQVFDIITGRDTKTLLPTEVILALVEREVMRAGRKAIFVDGFPRNLDQVSYSLYFRTLMGYRDDPDFFVFLDVPETVIGERMQGRVSCPACQTPRGLKLLRTKEIGYDRTTGEFFLICDNPQCPKPQRMVAKEGDELGIEALRDRIELDKAVMRKLLELQGVPKVFLRNTVPVVAAPAYIDEYEITPAYRYEWDSGAGQVRVLEEPWIVQDDNGTPSYSLLPAAVVVSLIKQTTALLALTSPR